MIKRILIATSVAAVVAVGGSLIHPFGTLGTPGNKQSVLREAQVDPETLAIFQRACQNCHSQQTERPWYSHVAPEPSRPWMHQPQATPLQLTGELRVAR